MNYNMLCNGFSGPFIREKLETLACHDDLTSFHKQVKEFSRSSVYSAEEFLRYLISLEVKGYFCVQKHYEATKESVVEA